MNNGVPVGVCVLPERAMNTARTVTYPNYIFEILAHAGVFHRRLTVQEIEPALEELGILVTIGDADFSQTLQDRLARWVESGGAWLSIAGICGMDELLGASRQEPEMWSWAGGVRSLGEGYLVSLSTDHPALGHVIRPVHFFGGSAVACKGAKVLARADDKHGRATDRPALLEHLAGQGRTLLIAPNLTGTIVRIQQGIGVTRDGVPASDGSGPVDDLVLKADDGCVLDWDLDRDPVPGMSNFRAYLEPAADVWREIFLRSIFHLALEQNVPLPLLWLYPRKLAALAHISHDSDSNEPEKAEHLLQLLEQANIKSTWCIILPGYEADLTSRIKAAGHELATHYDAIGDGAGWSEAQWQRQYRELRQMFGEAPVSNKNHGTRWEGDSEFWEWCARSGIELDQTKACSKTGECGYNFGTCQLYFPVTFRGETIDCLEMCTPVWDLHHFAPVAIFEPLLATVKRHHGILHQLFHPYHTVRPEVAESLLMSVRRAREEGLEWWTARQINRWERDRRGVRLDNFNRNPNGITLTLHSQRKLPDATLLCLTSQPNASDDPFTAWGFSFNCVIQTIEAECSVVVSFNNQRGDKLK